MTGVRLAVVVVLIALAPCAASSAWTSADADTVQPAPLDDGVTVYYFHRTIRCETCLKAEAFADTLVHTELAPEGERRELAWIVLNIDEERYAPVAEAYDVGPFALVISARSEGDEFYWKNVESIGDLVPYRGLFDEHVLGELRYALGLRAGGEPDDEQ